MDIENMNPDQFAALTPDQQRSLLESGELPQQEAAEPQQVQQQEQAAGQDDPQGVPAPQPSAEDQATEQRRGNPEVPLKQLREQNRQLQAQLDQVQALLSNPQALAQLVQQTQSQAPAQQPELAFEDPEVINQLVANHPVVQHLAQTNQQLQAFLAQQQEQARLQELRGTYGNDVDNHLAHFDATLPHMKGLDPEAKVLMVLGAMSKANPQTTPQDAKEMATKAIEQALSNPKQLPVTLGSAPPAKGNDAAPLDINSLGMGDFDKLTPAQIKEMAQKF